ncbi:MAG TPA: septal ring lytic transglycosylase RlpA family protein [Caulobacterales bacterium]|nr:septal ring lytic transglycosylase RlpA family protein [Caulobacterales bacterium]
MRDQSLTLFICLVLALSILALSARSTRAPAAAASVKDAAALASQARPAQIGLASWYGRAWQGRRTASGARFDARKLTAAHRFLPLNTKARVTNLMNGRSVEVTINDRGPYVPRRVIDLSAAAAKQLDMTERGIAPVRIEPQPPPADTEIASADRR